ncbi:thiolase C-terminal domain-containing protein [Kineobactrum salinum]|uniref:Acetyl-CoA acetyltransferase n=1 Tax=Kineobactrum salinum TaxID=2708301 RepID=A0A6C0U1N2_9GAMM|nr:acetyl-CoA acetyltransferase [Kineobactrum salinum]QIB65951.1 acetyl-CoA acetyltransferase [Kineobactrum salinum]
MNNRSLRGKVAAVGVGETTYYRHGESPDPEFVLCLKAILAACSDAGVDPRAIDGFASFSDDRNDPMSLATALGIDELKFSNMQWGGGGAGVAGAVANASAAIVGGLADCVVVYRALAQGQFGRFGQGPQVPGVPSEYALALSYGQMSPAQFFAPKAMRFMHEHGIGQEALRAISMASYHHAQTNQRAVMYGRPLTEEKYDSSRWIAEPFHLYDCCQENDGAAAIILVSADRARHLKQKPAYILGAAIGSSYRVPSSPAAEFSSKNYASSHFGQAAKRLYEMAQLKPGDIDVVQCYENFTGGVLMSLVEHGLFAPEEAMEVLQLENLLAPGGKMPLNTSGGNLAECYMHGLGLQIEAIRQLRGQSTNQVPDVNVSLAVGGPMSPPVSTALYGSEEAL